MFVMSPKFSAKYASKWKSFCFPVLTLALGASAAWAQAPSIVFDAQQTVGYGYSSPQSIAVSSNGTIFIADTGNNRIIALDSLLPEKTGINNVASTTPFVLTAPESLALDAHGNLFVGDHPASGGRIIELAGDGNGNLTGAARVVFSGAPLVRPISLVVDGAGTLFIGDYPASGDGVIYTLASGGGTPQPLHITGVPTQLIPAALVRDSSTNLYFVDNGTLNGGVYVVPAAGGAAHPIATGAFVINQPSGLARNAAGDLYILSLLGSGSSGQQVVIVPAASPTTPYILPNNGINTSSSMAFDPGGNLDVLDSVDGAVLQLSSPNPVNMGNIFPASYGQPLPQVQFNFEFNTPTALRGFRFLSQGDVSTELIQVANIGTCVNGNHNTIGGQTLSPSNPYNCKEYFQGNPTYPGIRELSIQVRGTGATILASVPVWLTGFEGVEVTYPLTEKTTATGLQQPQAIAISGLNKKVYVADTLAAKVYSINNLAGTALTPVSTGTIILSGPSALALDGAGNLFIADFYLGEVVEVPTTTGGAPSVVKIPVGLLQHPIALAVDYLGNMYIGDAGPGGVGASAGNPGYVVKIPAGGTPFKMTIPLAPPASIIFPQALAIDPYTAALLIGDGGDASVVGGGQVVQVSADGTSAGTGPINGVTNPTGLAFDQADDLYILDGIANTITVVTGIPNDQYPVQFNNTTLSSASALAVSAGGQSFLIANIGSGSNNNLVYLNGNASSLAFGSVSVGSQSPTMTATEYNIGNLNLTLKSPYFTTKGVNAAFSVLGSSTCGNGLLLPPSIPCTINVQFTPKKVGATNQQLSVDSDGYNSGVPVLTLTGTGK